MKWFLQSKTIWMNLFAMIVSALIAALEVIQTAGTEIDRTVIISAGSVFLIALLNGLLRIVTTTPVTVSKEKASTYIKMVVLLLFLPSLALAQPAKLKELESTTITTSVGSWKLGGQTPLLVSGTDSARVYVGTSGTDRIIIGKVAGESWVKAGVFGWFRVSAVTLAEYNAIQDATPADWQYPNFHPLELAFAVAVSKDGSKVLPPGAVVPRGLR